MQRPLSSVSFKVACFAVSLVVVALIITGILATHYSLRTAITISERESQVAMDFATKALNERLLRVEQAAEFLSERTDFITDDPRSAYAPLQELLFAYPDLATAGILFSENYYPQIGREYSPFVYWDTNRQHILEANSCDAGFTYLDDPTEINWQEGKAGRTCWCEPFLFSKSKVISIAYSVPLYRTNGDLFGVLCLCIDIDWLERLLKECNPYSDGVTAAVSKAGTVLFSHDSTMVMRDNIVDLAYTSGDTAYIRLANEVMMGHTGAIRARLSKNDLHFVYYRHVPSTGWTFFFIYPAKSIMSKLSHFIWHMVLIFVVTIVVLFLLLTVGIYRIIRPFSANLQTISEDKARIERDLRIASALQQRMLPSAASTQDTTIDIAGELVPARSVGGDIYDYFYRNGQLVFCIGDVSGKGVPAALFMVVVRTLLHEITRWELRPDVIMQRLNHGLIHTHSENMFCTMFLGVMNPTTGEISYCNAGHNPPVFYQHSGTGKTDFMHPHVDLPLGVEEATMYHTGYLTLRQGDGLFLYTDGVTESENTSFKQFGEQATLDTLRAHYSSSHEAIETLLRAVRTFSDGAEQSDDITCLCLKRS